jgi:hypothetical protein
MQRMENDVRRGSGNEKMCNDKELKKKGDRKKMRANA